MSATVNPPSHAFENPFSSEIELIFDVMETSE